MYLYFFFYKFTLTTLFFLSSFQTLSRMSDQEAIDAIDSLMRDMRHEVGMMTPLAGVPDALEDVSWAPPLSANPPPTTNVRKRPHSRRPPVVSRAPQIEPVATLPPINWTGLGDPRDYVMDAYDSVIAPTLNAPTAMMTKLRRHVFRRVVSEVATLQLLDRAATTSITAEEVVAVTISACEKVGIKFTV